MKKWMFVLLSAFLLTACGDKTQEATGNTGEEKETEVVTETTTEAQVENSQNEPTPDEEGNIIFTEVGQKADVSHGTLELLKFKEINESTDIAPLKVTLKDMKLFKLTNANKDFVDTVEYYTEVDVDDELTYLQVVYDIENTEDLDVEWLGLEAIVTDKGEQIGYDKDFSITDADNETTFFGKVKKENVDMFVIKDADISKVKFIFYYTQEAETFDRISEKQQVEYSF